MCNAFVCVCVCVCMRERMTSLLPLGAGQWKVIMACCHELSEFVDVCEREHRTLRPSPCAVCVRILHGVHKHNLHPQSPSLLAPIKFFLLLSLLSSPSFSLSIHPPFFFFFTQQLAYGDVHSITSQWRIILLLGCSLALLMSHCCFPSVALMATSNWLTQQRKRSPVTSKESHSNSHIAAWRCPTDSPHAGFL